MVSLKKPVLTTWYASIVYLLAAGWVMALPQMEDPRDVSWNITALMVTYDNERQLYVAEDDVIITGGQTRLEADYVEFNNKTKDAFAQGNVLFISGRDTLTCSAMTINLVNETGTINNGTIFVQDGNYYISGDKLRKTGKFTYDAQKGSITTCNGDSPDWKITGRNISVTIDGYGTASHTALWAKKVPVLYSPYLVFPVKTRRQTGLLFPMAGSSSRLGFEYEQPLFIALSRNTDATFYTHYMSERGIKLAGEFRYILSPVSKGMVNLDYLDDRTTGDSTQANEDFSFDSTSQRTNHDRYWFRMKQNFNIGNGFTAQIDADYVSDADYLLEFEDGFTGFNTTDENFESMFGRSLDEYDDTTRENRLLINKNWDRFGLNIQGLWYDNVVARQDDTDDTTLQTLPGIEFDAARQQVGSSGLYYTLDSEIQAFYRQDTQTDSTEDRKSQQINGQRADIHTRLYYPMNLGKFIFFEPYAGIRTTAWNTDQFSFTSDNAYAQAGNNKATRLMYDTGAQLSTILSRIYTPGTGFAEKIKHKIVPKIEYEYIPFKDQDDLPYFDTLDDIEETNLITWSLSNTFTARQKVTDTNGNATTKYKELAWIKLFQSYDIESERDADDTATRPWQALRLKYELNPFTYLSSTGDIALDPYSMTFTQVKVGATLKDNRGDSIYTYYRYETDTPYVLSTDEDPAVDTHTWYTRFNTRIYKELLAYFSFEQNLETHSNIERVAGIQLEKECWGLNLEFKKTDSDKVFAFMVTLKGIGEFGTQ